MEYEKTLLYYVPVGNLNMSHERKVPGASRSSMGAFCMEKSSIKKITW